MTGQEVLDVARVRYSSKDVADLERAITLATTAHEDQKRIGGEPYVTHPLSVAAILIEWEMDIDSVLAGVLHDTVEDTEITLENVS